ncbi:hypothetical protein, partial [Thiolapillus sp.]|uniref:hypothetical protein n=1 Tax=Thiolapillus sp. TaxID=2017437 RepID=UPI003AF86C87
FLCAKLYPYTVNNPCQTEDKLTAKHFLTDALPFGMMKLKWRENRRRNCSVLGRFGPAALSLEIPRRKNGDDRKRAE